MGKEGAWWNARYYTLLLLMIDAVSSLRIGLRVNYTKEKILPMVQLIVDRDSGKRPYEARQLIKTYQLKPFKKLPSNVTEEEDSPDTIKNSDEVIVAPISFETDEDSLDSAQVSSSLTTTVLNPSEETDNFQEKLPEDSQILLAAADGEQEAAILGTIVGQLARPWDQLLGGQISSMILALNQTAGSSSSSSQQGGQQSGGSSGGSQSGGGQSGQQGGGGKGQGGGGGGTHGGGQSGQGGGGGQSGQGGGGGQSGQGGGGGQSGQGGGGGQSGQGGGGGQSGQGGGGGQSGQGGGGGGQGGGGQVQCVSRGAICTVFTARQCCPGTSCSVFPLGILGPLYSGPLSGPVGALALGSCQPVVG